MDTDSHQAQLIWANYGFLGNPFDTSPLSLFSDSRLFVGNAYLPREHTGLLNPSDQLDAFFKAEGGGCVMVEGDIGVGKTSLVNYHRHKWRKPKNGKSLFTPVSEVSTEVDWDKRRFQIDLLSTLARAFITSANISDKELEENRLLMEVIATTGTIYSSKSGKTFGATIAGTGGQVTDNKTTTIHTANVSNTQLLDYLNKMVALCKSAGHRGVALHMDNVENLLKKTPGGCRAFFDEIRDILQLRDVYFVFVAETGFFQEIISPLEKVRSIFYRQPINVSIFTEDETVAIVNRRYEVLAHKDRNYIRPAEDELVRRLHAIHEGRIRRVMNDLKSLVLEFLSPNRVETLKTEDAIKSLKSLVEERLNVLTKGEREFVRQLPLGNFSNQDLVEQTQKSKQHVGKIFAKLKKYNFIQAARDAEDEHHYQLASEFRILSQDS